MGLIEDHLSKYPLMQIADKIKLLMQAYMGPGHLVNDRDRVKNNLEIEYELCKNICYNYELVEEIGHDFVRVYIKPFYEKYHSFDKLIDLFVLSSSMKRDKNIFVDALLKLKDKESLENKKIIDDYIASSNILISHSNIYKENYYPHYLVVSKKFLNEIL